MKRTNRNKNHSFLRLTGTGVALAGAILLTAASAYAGPENCPGGNCNPGQFQAPEKPVVRLISGGEQRTAMRRDPMVCVASQCNPGSKLVVYREGRSLPLAPADLEKARTLGDLEHLAVNKAFCLKAQLGFEPQVASKATAWASPKIHDPKQVYWPGTTYVQKGGQDRYGKPLPEQFGIVDGAPQINEQRMNFATGQMENVTFDGRLGKSAPAFLTTQNVLISEPRPDHKMMADAELKETEARNLKGQIDGLTARNAEIAKLVAMPQVTKDANQLKAYNEELQKNNQSLTSINQTFTQANSIAQDLKRRGCEFRSHVVFVGAVPRGATVSLANERLAAEGTSAIARTTAARRSLEEGLLMTSIGGLSKDRVSLTVSIPGQSSRTSMHAGSTTDAMLQIPDIASDRPVTVIDGVKYYAAKIDIKSNTP